MFKVPVRIGMIGAGIISTRHLGNLQGFEDVQIVSIVDPLIDRAQNLAQRAGAKTYADFNAMLEHESMDGVYICIPPFAHGAPEKAVIEHQLSFFVEKPLAIDFEVAAQIASMVTACNLITATGYHWRYLDVTERAQDLLSKNPAHLTLGYRLDFTPPPSWWPTASLSGGSLSSRLPTSSIWPGYW